MLAGIDLNSAAPDFEALLSSAIALGIKATRDEGPSPRDKRQSRMPSSA